MKKFRINQDLNNLLGRVVGGYTYPRLEYIGGSRLTYTEVVSPQEQYLAETSVTTKASTVFPEFFVRECMRTQPVKDRLEGLLVRVASVVEDKRGGRKTLAAAAAFMADRGSMHTVFHDLYLLLSGAGAVRRDKVRTGLWDRALHDAIQKDPAALTKLKCSGDPVRSVLTALSIMQRLVFSKKDVKQEKQKQRQVEQDAESDAASEPNSQDTPDSDTERKQSNDHSENTTQQDHAREASSDQENSTGRDQDVDESDTASDDQAMPDQHDDAEEEVDSIPLTDALSAALANVPESVSVLSEFQSIAGELAGTQSHEHSVSDIASLLAALEILETKANTKYLEGVVQALGRVESIVNDALSVNVHGDGDILDVQQDDDPSRMLAAEYANLACPELEYTFLSRLADHALLTSERRGVGESGMGPFVILLDKSGSMALTLDDGYETLSSFTGAFAVQLFRTARHWQRPAMMYAFDSSLMKPSVVFSPMRQQSKSAFVQQLMKIAGIVPAGGTDFTQALHDVSVRIKKDAPHNAIDLDRADVLILSDGCSDLSAECQVANVRDRFAPGTRFFGLFFVAGQQSAEQLECLEKRNSSLLDLCVAACCDDDSLRKNCGRFFTEVLQRSFYEDSLV